MRQKPVSIVAIVSCLLFLSFCDAEIDRTRYITIDQIKPGMTGYCLTVYKGVEPEKFDIKVLDVVRDISPGQNAILVVGTDERFIHTGPVAGCSGSPVYIDGRLAGALSFGWSYSKDALYGVTPIDEMLAVGRYNPPKEEAACISLDFSKPVNLKDAFQQTINSFKVRKTAMSGLNPLPCPIATTLPASCFENFAEIFQSAGFIPVSAGGTGRLSEYSDVPMRPGGILALPLVFGDIELSAVGTITEVVDDKVYAFGHSFLGEGAIDIPMATGYVHTVVANLVRSFKFGQPVDIKGAVSIDQSTAIVGTIGRKAKTIPMKITVERYDDEKVRTYNCQVVSHHYLTPLLANICIDGAAMMRGALPQEHSIEYRTRMDIDGYGRISFENFSSLVELEECIGDSIGALSLIMNNPYYKPQISNLEFEIKIFPKPAVCRIWSFEVSSTTVKPGQTITADIWLESYLAEHKNYTASITIPHNLPPGEYRLMLSGFGNYMDFVSKSAPYKYTAENFSSLVRIINDLANIKRDGLHLVLILPPQGIAIETSQLSYLPLSKTLLLNDEKRSSVIKPAAQWLEQTIAVDAVVLDSRTVNITVQEK